MPKQSGYFGMLLSRKTQALRPVRSLIAPVIASPRVPVATVEGPRPAVSVPDSAAPREVRAVDQVAAKVAPQMKPVSSIPEVRPTPAPEIRVIRETVAGAPKQVRTEVVHVAREAPKPRAPEFSQEKPAVEKPEPVGPKTVSVTEQIPVYLAAPEVAIETTVIAARSQPEAARPPVVRMETTIDWPPQLDAGQRNTVRVEVERQARERIAAVPAARSNGAQKVEVRVDQVNVRFDAPAQPRTAATRPAAESSFDGFFALGVIMATEKALQLVTLTVADLLSDRMVRNDVAFTFARPLTPAASATPSPRLNLYLYQLLENPAFRNEEEPTQAIPGQYGSPPLALSLYYLITSYGKPTEIAAPENGAAFPLDSLTELDAQYILADAMRVLHDTPIITRNTPRLRAAAPPQIMDPGLQSDFESIRIVPRQMSLEDLTKVWTAFKEDFQRSVGYEVTIVRVQRPQQRPANAPVLRRNIPIVPSVSPAMSIVLATAAATTDSSVYFSGNGLGDPSLRIQITDASRLGYPPAPVLLTPQTDANNLTYFQIPSANPLMQPGPKLIQAVITAPAPGVRPVASAPVPLTLLPNIATINPQSGPFNGTVSVTISGTALGVAFSDPTLPPSPMVPAVLFGGYVVPFTDLDLTGLPSTIVATLNAQPATSPQPPSGSTPVPVRVRVNGVENQGWQLDPVTGQYGFLAGLLYTPS